ncbi:hypothetical protein ACFJGV_10840 [Cnuibacter sp. UC19_7]|uniref:DUF7882 family protein n=1 Tax=Cnuibacter sp. UC19_7 TaxID=3350166 RepID=UPI00366A73E1
MGTLQYGYKGRHYDFDDRTLIHLRIVIIDKLRRHESFTLSFSTNSPRGEVRETLWLNPSIPIRFSIDDLDQNLTLNRTWIEQLARTAANGDMKLTSEPDRTS